MMCNHCLGAKLVAKGSDKVLGRWSWIKFRGKQGSRVLVITAYQVSQTSATGLSMGTVYMQQWRKLAPSQTRVNPRAQFWEDLTTFTQQAISSQEEEPLMLDTNADLTDAGLSTFLVACGLYDLHDTSNEDSPPETYYRRKQKIDFCLGTMGIATSVTRAGLTSYEGGLKFSDHQALFIDISEDALFSSQGVDPTSCRSRGLWMKNREAL